MLVDSNAISAVDRLEVLESKAGDSSAWKKNAVAPKLLQRWWNHPPMRQSVDDAQLHNAVF